MCLTLWHDVTISEINVNTLYLDYIKITSAAVGFLINNNIYLYNIYLDNTLFLSFNYFLFVVFRFQIFIDFETRTDL